MDALESLKQESVGLDGCVFPLGHAYERLGEELWRRDRRLGLCLGALLDPTPICWVRLPSFRIGRRMVTNGEYLSFLQDESEEDFGGIYEDARIWQFVWSDSDFRIGQHTLYGVQGDRTIAIEEDYTGLSSFIEAFIESIRFEIERVLSLEEGEGERRASHVFSTRYVRAENHELDEVMAFARFKLRHVQPGGMSSGWWESLTPRERESLNRLSSDKEPIKRVEGHIEQLVSRLSRHYERSVDPRRRKLLEKKPSSVETVGFLINLASAIKDSKVEDTVPLRKVLYPRYWASHRGDTSPGSGSWFAPPRTSFQAPSRPGAGGGPVPWEERPVVGITLYEALGYTAWLSHRTGWKVQVSLPNEAQFERAASWPGHFGGATGEPLDLGHKSLYPWGDLGPDFHDFFGLDGQSLESLFSDQARYRELLERTSRPVKEGAIEQLLGFGWQWTTDRFDARMPRYERLHELPSQELASVDGGDVPVYDYRPHQHRDHAHFVVRGAPYTLGGPGLTTRRFALYPLRAYPDVGFRWSIFGEDA